MSKNYQKAAIGRIFALAVLIAGTCSVAATAWATTCFLPSGNCSTGRVGNDGDGGGSGGGDEPDTPVDTCKDVEGNFVSKSDYDLMSPTSCFKCSTCETNNQTKYKCAATIGSNWDGKHCCGLDLKWDNDASKCCSILLGCPTLCVYPMVAQGKKCVCPEGRAETTSGKCCLVGQTAHGNLCCNAGEHAETTICCPTNKHEEGGTCVCDANYVPDGTGCKKKDSVPTITINIKEETGWKSDNTAADKNGIVNTLRTNRTVTSFTTTASDNSTHTVKLKFVQVETTSSSGLNSGGSASLKAKSSVNTGLISTGLSTGISTDVSTGIGGSGNTGGSIGIGGSSNSSTTMTLAEGDTGETYYYHTTAGLTDGLTSSTTKTSCSVTLNIDRKDIASFTYNNIGTACNQLTKGLSALSYDTVYQYNGYNVKFVHNSKCTPDACTGYDYTEDTLSDKVNNVETCDPGCGEATKYKCSGLSVYDSATKSCSFKTIDLPKITITINFADTKNQIGVGHTEEDDYYYRTIKFDTTSSDSQSHEVVMKTYPAQTCMKTGYVVGSTIPSATEGKNTANSIVSIKKDTETVYESTCGYANTKILAVSTAKVETYVDGTLVDSVEPKVEGMGAFHSTLNNRTHESNGYIIKYVEGFTCKQKGYKTKADCSADETFTAASGIKDADGSTQCGTCKPKGFTIYAGDMANGTYKCSSYNNSSSTDVSMRLYLKSGSSEAKDINGNTVEKITTKGVTYPAGTYQVCLYRSQNIVYIINFSITENGSRFKCWDFPFNGSAVNVGCETSQEGVKQTSCYEATFEAGKEYTITQGWAGSGSSTTDGWKCNLIPSFDY